MSESEALLSVSDVVVDFNTRHGKARVLDHVTLSLNSGEILGVVGESGCGKSMTALSIMGLVPNAHQFAAREFDGPYLRQ